MTAGVVRVECVIPLSSLSNWGSSFRDDELDIVAVVGVVVVVV